MLRQLRVKKAFKRKELTQTSFKVRSHDTMQPAYARNRRCRNR